MNQNRSSLRMVAIHLLCIGAFTLTCACDMRASLTERVARAKAKPAEPAAPLLRPSGATVETTAAAATKEELSQGKSKGKPDGSAPSFRAVSDPNAPWPDDGGKVLLSFVHISDTHVGKVPKTPEGPIDDSEAFKVVIKEINTIAPRPDIAIITGDLTDGWHANEIERFKAIRKGIKIPNLIVPGNHDLSFDPTPDLMSSWEAAFPKVALPQMVEKKGFAFIGFDSQVYNSKRVSLSIDQFADSQWKAVVKMTRKAQNSGKRVLLFYHIPALPNFFRKKVKSSWQTRYLQRFLTLLKKQKVEAALTGHFHRDEFYMKGSTLFLNAPPVSRWETRDTSYRIYRITEKGWMYRQIYTGPERSIRSYEVDLRGVTEHSLGNWVDSLSPEDIRKLWEKRYAGDDATEKLYGELNTDHFREFQKNPFAYQPANGKVRFLEKR